MAVYTEERYLSRVAGADLSSSQYRIVKMNSSRQVVLASAATDMLFGVLANAPKQNETASVCGRNGDGTFKVIAGGTIAVGDAVTSDANGAAITTTTAGNEVLGFAQEAAVAGQIFEYLPAFRKY